MGGLGGEGMEGEGKEGSQFNSPVADIVTVKWKTLLFKYFHLLL